MGSHKYRRGLACIFLIFFSVYMIILLYFINGEDDIIWNQSAVKTKCTIKGHQTFGSICTCLCDCNNVLDFKLCNTSQYECFSGYIIVNYNDTIGKTYYAYIEIYPAQSENIYEMTNTNETKIQQNLDNYYPIYERINCYYDDDNPGNIKLYVRNFTLVYIYIILFACIMCFFPICWLLRIKCKDAGIVGI